MYHFKRYQKAFTFFVSGGYMKFPNLIIRIVLDLNKYICSWNINFRRKFHELQATESFWEYMRNGQMVSVQTYNEIIKTFKIWRYPAIKGIYTFISIYDSKYTYIFSQQVLTKCVTYHYKFFFRNQSNNSIQ